MPAVGFLGSLEDRIARRALVDPDTGCWVWTGKRRADRYGVIWSGGPAGEGREVRVHRASYEIHVGPIAEGLDLDHLCRNRGCCNPEHLEQVTRAENLRRGGGEHTGGKTHCKRGHEFSPENTYITRRGYRNCRECHRLNERERRATHARTSPRPSEPQRPD